MKSEDTTEQKQDLRDARRLGGGGCIWLARGMLRDGCRGLLIIKGLAWQFDALRAQAICIQY